MFEAETILNQQRTQLGLKLDFFFQRVVTFQFFQRLELLVQVSPADCILQVLTLASLDVCFEKMYLNSTKDHKIITTACQLTIYVDHFILDQFDSECLNRRSLSGFDVDNLH